MKARGRSVYRCQSCGFASAKPGTCPDCARQGAFVALVEERAAPARSPRLSSAASAGAGRDQPVPLADIRVEDGDRTGTGIGELDRVLGGGVVRGSLVLVGGDPGVGKSTLLLGASRALAERMGPVLYVSGEESAAQVKMRAERMGIVARDLYFVAETDVHAIVAHVEKLDPRVLVVDSIQTMFLPDLESAPGSVAQVRECAWRLQTLAKSRGLATFLVGHVTKDGALAGPRVLEHLVDTVLYFEGERHHAYRVLRAVKNRFGSTNEIGVFEMVEAGLVEVKSPSSLFLAERPRGVPGSVIVSSLEGTRPLLLELQALVAPASFGTPRRTVLGADYNRVCLLLAVIEKRVGLSLQTQDAFINVAGGARITEPAADLGVVIAAASSYLNRPVQGDLVVIGEVGLAGEVRAVMSLPARLKEAAALGFPGAVVPKNNIVAGQSYALPVQGVASVEEAVSVLLGEA
ncbi:MAG TPA: DNA repair protein RadA [Candidatus Limnocylindrales bacterium]|nr:DNA repair protein RadA [Candidatus Limnocylindrales bacterium]